MTTTKKVDALGFDRNQIAAIRRAYASNKTIYKKMDAISAKIEKLYAEYQALEKEAETWDAPAKQLSMSVLGVELNSRDLLAAHEDPETFKAEHPELSSEETPAESTEEPTDENLEEPVQEQADPFGV